GQGPAAGRADRAGGDRANPGERPHRGGAPARGDQVRVAARLRHRDLRGPRLRLRARRDHLDPGGRAALRGAAAEDHPRADPRRGPALPQPWRLRAAGLRAQGGRRPMRRLGLGRALLTLLLVLVAAPAGAETLSVTRTKLPNGLTVLVRENP